MILAIGAHANHLLADCNHLVPIAAQSSLGETTDNPVCERIPKIVERL
ncbi:hypothetical protein ABIE89_000405 [Bradyrhizobium niftali]